MRTVTDRIIAQDADAFDPDLYVVTNHSQTQLLPSAAVEPSILPRFWGLELLGSISVMLMMGTPP
jgi:hypothetical protein